MISDTSGICKAATAALLLLLALACHKNERSPVVALQYDVSPKPPRVGVVTIDVRVLLEGAKWLNGARVELEGNMSHSGMSPVISETKEVEPGKYRGTLEFTMAGDWIILVHITLPGGQRVQQQLELNVAPS